MVKVREDMTGWIMAEHGVPDSRLTVIKQIDDIVYPNGTRSAQWLCECSCEEHNLVEARGYNIKCGRVKSCGCLAKEVSIQTKSKTNKNDLSGQYGVLWLENTGKECYFDLEDSELILSYCWHEDAYGYATTNIRKENGRRTQIKMHKLLGFYNPDHHNQNKLDNRKENLVPCTTTENMRNRPKQSNNTSGFIGVVWYKKSKKWAASIVVSKKRIYLGMFNNKEDAIKTRLTAEKKYFGEFAPQRHLFKEYGIV